MSFRILAEKLTSLGIPVVPVVAGEKRCRITGWQNLATTDPSVLTLWNSSDPSANTGAVAKMDRPDGCVILDCDVPDLVERIETETGFEMPETFTVVSAGKRCPHLYFRHTAASRLLGNRKLANQFDLKAHNSYVVGPGSTITTDGGPRTYDIVKDVEIALIPDWLVDWIDSVTAPEKKSGNCSSTAPVAGSFDIHDFLDHYQLNYHMKGNWYITDICPVADHKHAQSTETGFFYDGSNFGFKCFAANCKGSDMSVGDVISHMNKSEGMKLKQPYTGDIWEKPVASIDPEVAAADWFVPLKEFAVREIPPRKKLLWDTETTGCVLFAESLNQVFSYRGIGKSMFVAGLVNCVANGGKFLRYESDGGHKVLYCDGELPDSVLQERLNGQIEKRDNITLMHAGSVPNQMFPRLSEEAWQNEFIKRVDVLKPEVIVFDTLTACFRFDTNDPDGWESVNKFYISLRLKGYCVLVVHHAGKNGSQRGRTDGDDNLDLAIRLDAPKGWAPGDGLRFDLSYEKVRAGSRLTEFSATYTDKWEVTVQDDDAEVIRMKAEGKSVRAIADKLDLDRNKVQRIIEKARKSGTLEEKDGEE